MRLMFCHVVPFVKEKNNKKKLHYHLHTHMGFPSTHHPPNNHRTPSAPQPMDSEHGDRCEGDYDSPTVETHHNQDRCQREEYQYDDDGRRLREGEKCGNESR